ncbi:MAG: hypothetical protein ABIO49_06385 [Dokdonella sp.]
MSEAGYTLITKVPRARYWDALVALIAALIGVVALLRPVYTSTNRAIDSAFRSTTARRWANAGSTAIARCVCARAARLPIYARSSPILMH